jgi:hypothetical protein
MKPLMTLLAATSLAACAQTERNLSMANGMLRVEPHPIHADSARVTTVSSPVLLDPLGRGTPEGYRNVVVSLLGPKCANAPIIEEGRVRLTTGREDAALRVICPAVVRRPDPQVSTR